MIELNVGDLVVKNPDTWKVTDFDDWGRGEGVGVVSEVNAHGDVDVKWKGGRCYEDISELKLFMTLAEYWRDRMDNRMSIHYESARLFTILKGFYCDALLYGDHYNTLHEFWNSKRPYGSKALPESIAFNLGWDSRRILEYTEIPDSVVAETSYLHAAVGVMCTTQDENMHSSMLDKHFKFLHDRVLDPIMMSYLSDDVDSLISEYPSILKDFMDESHIELNYLVPGIENTAILIIKEFWRKQNDVQ